ncbi:MAG: hypothetical protein LUC37_04205 [Prevotella sp.]|nr:hypothetical protein [Prevotella sp.]
MRKTRYFIFVVLGLFLLASCQESIEKRAFRECEEYTKKNCPVSLAQDVILDSMTFETSTRTIHYFYSLEGALDTTLVEQMTSKDEILDGLRNATNLKRYKDAGFSFAYTYFSSKNKGKELMNFLFTSQDLGEKKSEP